MKKLSTICNRANIKPAVLLPILALTFLLFGVGLWYVGPNAQAAGAGQVQVTAEEPWRLPNPLFPDIVRIPDIPFNPDETSYLQQLFNEATSAAETLRGKANVRQATSEIRNALVAELERFLTERPDSAWAPSLLCNLGLHYRTVGRYTLALETWEKAWLLLNESKDPVTRKIANTAFTQWTSLLASLGRIEDLAVLIEATQARDFGKGKNRLLMNQTLEGYRQMKADPASAYRCGALAMAQLSSRMGGPKNATLAFVKAPSPEGGFSVQQLIAIAHAQNLRVSAVVRESNAEVIVPSLVHWAQEHYAAIVDQRGSDYLVKDPTFGVPRWISAETIGAEASGVFIVPADRLPRSGYRLLTDEEAASIRGRGNPNNLPDGYNSNCTTCPCPPGSNSPSDHSDTDDERPTGSGCGSCGGGGIFGAGMAQWHVSEPYLNLWIHDTPWSYQPSKGDRIAPQLSYKQRNLDWDSLETETTLGAMWNFNYWSVLNPGWVTEGTPFLTRIELPGGGLADFDFDGTEHTSTNFYNNFVLTYAYDTATDSVTNFTLIQPNGRQLIYDRALRDANGYANTFMLSRIVASDGSQTLLEYNVISDREVLLERIIDCDNQTNVITYVSGTPWIQSVVSPFAQTNLFQYDVDSEGNPILESITDAVGIKSEFGYDFLGYITNLTTPYGITQFDYTDINDPWTYELQRRLTITHPDSTTECYLWYTMYGESTDSFPGNEVPSGTPLENFDNINLKHRNTWYWNRQQFATLSSNFRTSGSYIDLTADDKLKGRWRHWLQRYGSDASHFEVAGLALERSPSPDGTTPGQKTWYDYADKYLGDPTFAGTQILPSVIARVMPDGSTWYEYHEHNQYGLTTNKIEKWVEGGNPQYRTNRYVYAGNGLDLLEHWQTHGAGEVRKVAYSYNSNHQPLTMTNALNEVTTYTYSGSKLSSVLTPAGVLTTYTYNGTHGQLEKVVDSVSGTPVRTNAYTWEYGLIKTHTDERGLKVTNYWDNLDRLTARFYPDGSYIQNVYYLFGSTYPGGNGTNILDVTASRDQNGNWTFYGYTPLRQIESVTNSLGYITKYEYCSCGGPEFIRQAYGTSAEFATQQVFDLQGRLTHVLKPGGINVTYQYDSLGNLTNLTDALGSTANWFDNLGRLVAVSNAFGQVSRTIYDSEGMVRTNIDANGVSTVMTYDDLHRIRTQTIAGGGTNSWGYTANISGPTSHTNELGKVTQYAYNALGWKLSEINVGMATNSFTYNEAGDLRTLSDGKVQVTKWGYDVFGRVTSKTNAANTAILRYSYHPNGSLSNRWTAAKGNTVYSYDAVGNLTNVNYAASTDLKFKYDAMNRVTNMVDAAGTTTNYYDVSNRYMIEDGPWANDTVTNRWNTAGLPASTDVLQPSGYFSIGYQYDAARRLTNVFGTAGSFTNYYHAGLNLVTAPSRLIQKMGLANNAYITNAYDSLARLTSTKLKNGGTHAELNRHDYVYNYGHQRTQQTRKDGDYVDYLYDDVGQLYSAKTYALGGAETTSQRRGYTYDPAWNLTKTTNNATVSTRTVNNLNQITSGYSYDANGNRTNTSGNYSVYVYDDENQLIEWYNNPAWYSGSKKTQFIYDGKGRLRRRIESNHTGSDQYGYTWGITSDTRYIYSGMLCIQERNGSNTPEVSYTRASDLSGTLEGAGGIGGLLARSHGYSAGTWSNHNFYHADGNGNITMMLDPSQSAVATYKYDPYGNLFTSSGTLAATNLYRFSSKVFMTNSTMYYYGYRFYDPTLQRWLNRDPLEEEGGLNLYAFVHNNSITSVDSFGLQVTGSGTLAAEPTLLMSEEAAAAYMAAQARAAAAAAAAAEAAAAASKTQERADCAPRKQKPRCPPDILAALNAAVETACKGNQSGCRQGDSVEIARGKIFQLKRCLRARNTRENRCYGGGDSGHITQMANKLGEIKNCYNILKR